MNTGVPFEQTAFTCVSAPPSLSPCWKAISTFSGPDPSTLTRQPLSGCAIRSVMTAPVQRTVTCPPVTLTVRSIGVVELPGLFWPSPDGEGDVDPWWLVELLGVAVAGVVAEDVVLDAEGAGVAPVLVAPSLGVALSAVGPR
ncbi:MAG: hypothetical protein ABI474_01555 [Actinomycetota bacterium]